MNKWLLAAMMTCLLGMTSGLSVQAQIAPAVDGADEAKILGGRVADIRNWPWAVALVHARMTDSFRGQFCGGTLIADRWVITAAHCVTDSKGNLKYEPGDVHVVNGRTDLRTTEGDRIEVTGYVVHPQYNPKNNDSDIALLRLQRAPKGGSIWGILPLIPGGDPAGLTAAGKASWVAGWGALGPNGPYPYHLHEAQLPLVSQAALTRAYPPPFFLITDNMIGAGPGDGSTDTCQGDSGGPLMVRDETGKHVLAGVTSWGLRCGTPDIYGVYVRLANYCPWIKGLAGVGDCRASNGGSGGSSGCSMSSGQAFGGEWLILAAALIWMVRRSRVR